MKKNILIIIVLLFLAACGSEPEPTPTTTPTKIPLPTATATHTPTVTNTPTPHPTATQSLIYIPEGGFHFTPPWNYQIDYQGYITNLADQNFEVWYTLAGILEPVPFETSGDLVFEFVMEIDSRDDISFDLGEYYEYTIDGLVGTASDLTGTILDEPTDGLAVAVIINQDHFFFAIAISKNNQKWLEEGLPNFEAMLASIRFDTSSVLPKDTCEVSTDETYGYTEENPIRVGGGAFDGPPRERAFLDSLLGPNGEDISYERQGSFGSGDTILDIYEITYRGSSDSITLYIDEYSYEDLKAPISFTCGSDFPLTAP